MEQCLQGLFSIDIETNDRKQTKIKTEEKLEKTQLLEPKYT